MKPTDHHSIVRRVPGGSGRGRRQQEHREQPAAPAAAGSVREHPRHEGLVRRQRLPVRPDLLRRQRERRDAASVIVEGEIGNVIQE